MEHDDPPTQHVPVASSIIDGGVPAPSERSEVHSAAPMATVGRAPDPVPAETQGIQNAARLEMSHVASALPPTQAGPPPGTAPFSLPHPSMPYHLAPPNAAYGVPYSNSTQQYGFYGHRPHGAYAADIPGPPNFGNLVYLPPAHTPYASAHRGTSQSVPIPGLARAHESTPLWPGAPPYNRLPIYPSGSGNPEPTRRGSRSAARPDPRRPPGVSTTLRGPPRKPKQSGHALWVGNLPPTTTIFDLKDHFAHQATADIESVFFISKSNCAFVNYKTESSCARALSRFHDSRFHGVRLVCRLRRGNGSQLGVSLPASSPGEQRVTPASTSMDTARGNDTADEARPELDAEPQPWPTVEERFFIIKSLTMEDLDRSVQSGIWATQSHNEAALDQAYQTAQSVYLIFSANKSGEYFGYARMESGVDDPSISPTEVSTWERPPARSPSLAADDVPRTIPTPATATAPEGRVIDDSARGTIFWEASNVDETTEDDVDRPPSQEEAPDDSPLGTSAKTAGASLDSVSFGKPFRIRWMSTDKLPFYRTRGLRNPWNTNREVKIARDGTQLEPTVGRKLVDMFGTHTIVPPGWNPPVPQPVIVGHDVPASRVRNLTHGRSE